MTKLQVPFFRPSLQDHEVNEVVETLRSGWLTSGPRVQRFEADFGTAVGAANAVALNSCTAALHLAVEALGLKPGDGVLVPTMTFAATAEVVRYQGAIPILVDCDPQTLNLDLVDAARKMASWPAGNGAHRLNGQTATTRGKQGRPAKIVGVMPVHVGGLMMDLGGLEAFAKKNRLWIVEDAAHAFPAGWRRTKEQAWQQRTKGPSAVTCYSFYANKTITTGEGGMAVTDNAKLAQRMKMMSLHGLSHDAWGRYSAKGNWDYKIVAPGYKYNLTDVAAALGIHQLARAEAMRLERERIASRYADAFATIAEIELPPANDASRIHAWHLFVLKLRLRQLRINRNEFINELKRAGVGCSVHWRPLHLHPYYQKTFGFRSQDFPVATASWKRVISLPIFPGMRADEIEYVIATIKRICARYAR
jgi:perosamine synthetase